MHDVPGFMTMTAGEVLAGTNGYLEDRAAKQKAWDEALPGLLLAWRNGLGFWGRFFYAGWPKDADGLVKRYNDESNKIFDGHTPDVEGLGYRPGTAGRMIDFNSAARRFPADRAMFVNVDLAATIKSWIPKQKENPDANCP